MSIEAREAVLSRIKQALDGKEQENPEASWSSLPRAYHSSPQLDVGGRLKLLENRLRDYDAEVTQVADQDVAQEILNILLQRGAHRTLLPVGFPARWISPGLECFFDGGYSPRTLNQFDAVVTGATAAIAETGSLVLQATPGQGRRAVTLVPDFHLCLVRVEDVVETVPEAFARLERTATLPTTFISGPSATADIEMTRIKGVHGPRFLHVLLVTGAGPL